MICNCRTKRKFWVSLLLCRLKLLKVSPSQRPAMERRKLQKPFDHISSYTLEFIIIGNKAHIFIFIYLSLYLISHLALESEVNNLSLPSNHNGYLTYSNLPSTSVR
jgi:hypothetical protein